MNQTRDALPHALLFDFRQLTQFVGDGYEPTFAKQLHDGGRIFDIVCAFVGFEGTCACQAIEGLKHNGLIVYALLDTHVVANAGVCIGGNVPVGKVVLQIVALHTDEKRCAVYHNRRHVVAILGCTTFGIAQNKIEHCTNVLKIFARTFGVECIGKTIVLLVILAHVFNVNRFEITPFDLVFLVVNR